LIRLHVQVIVTMSSCPSSTPVEGTDACTSPSMSAVGTLHATSPGSPLQALQLMWSSKSSIYMEFEVQGHLEVYTKKIGLGSHMPWGSLDIKQELAALACVYHPHITHLVCCAKGEGSSVYVMEHMDKSLSQMLTDRSKDSQHSLLDMWE
jgi:hypothetical protein